MSDHQNAYSFLVNKHTSMATLAQLLKPFEESFAKCVRDVDEVVGLFDIESDPTRVQMLINQAHQLRGSSGSYGYPELGHAMAVIEDQLQLVSSKNLWKDPYALQVVRSAVEICKLRMKGDRDTSQFARSNDCPGDTPNDSPGNTSSQPIVPFNNGGKETVILLVEDDPYFIESLRSVLHSGGQCTMLSATSLRETESILNEMEPDLIILDLNLTNISGIETFHAMHALAPDIPILILSASEGALADEAVACGAQDYLIKGRITADALKRCIRYSIVRFKAEQNTLRLQAIEDFVETLAHDMRVPLQGMKMVTGHLLSDAEEDLPARLKETISVMDLSNNILLSRLQRLLELYEYESGRVKPELTTQRLDLAVEQMIEKFRSRMEERAIRLSFEKTQECTWSRVDIGLFEKAFDELLDNAVKFAPPSKQISIVVGQSAGSGFVQISNEGLPIPKAEQRKIFKKFWRGTPGISYVASTGLGLYHCAQIIRVLGGTVACSCNDGRNTFTLRIPASQTP
jgi:Osmosensitive K+ channel histidine kinase